MNELIVDNLHLQFFLTAWALFYTLKHTKKIIKHIANLTWGVNQKMEVMEVS